MYGLQPDVFLSILRHLLGALGAFMVAKGWVSSDMAGQIAGSMVTLIAISFAGFFHATSNGTIQTLSTTSNAAPNAVETRIREVAKQVATANEAAIPAHVDTTVTVNKVP